LKLGRKNGSLGGMKMPMKRVSIANGRREKKSGRAGERSKKKIRSACGGDKILTLLNLRERGGGTKASKGKARKENDHGWNIK